MVQLIIKAGKLAWWDGCTLKRCVVVNKVIWTYFLYAPFEDQETRHRWILECTRYTWDGDGFDFASTQDGFEDLDSAIIWFWSDRLAQTGDYYYPFKGKCKSYSNKAKLPFSTVRR